MGDLGGCRVPWQTRYTGARREGGRESGIGRSSDVVVGGTMEPAPELGEIGTGSDGGATSLDPGILILCLV
jgi:hypothetical protein